MTPQQTEKLKKKIADVKRILAAEKRKFGAYDDSRGLRYLPAGYFVQLGDYQGGLAYLNWFYKNFPDDGGFPEFLFELAILLFKTERFKEAASAVFRTFCSNPYWIDSFLGRALVPLDIWHSSNLMQVEYTQALTYASDQPDLVDFGDWLRELITTEDFIRRSSRYVEIYRQLKTETDKESRRRLVQEAFQLQEGGLY
jgi:tetratricopeptide (TPR) repeat protein